MKPVILMALTLFLISAPAPDAGDIAEITSNFIVPDSIPGLQAGQQTTRNPVSKPGENLQLSATSETLSNSVISVSGKPVDQP